MAITYLRLDLSERPVTDTSCKKTYNTFQKLLQEEN